jgi:hypothetical protein
VARRRKHSPEVFLNVPYDKKFERLFLAFIAGTSAFEAYSSRHIRDHHECSAVRADSGPDPTVEYSIHDLSRVEIDRTFPSTPRFNMPFELGLSVALEGTARIGTRGWFVCESRNYRLAKSLSDLNGTDPFIHDGMQRTSWCFKWAGRKSLVEFFAGEVEEGRA